MAKKPKSKSAKTTTDAVAASVTTTKKQARKQATSEVEGAVETPPPKASKRGSKKVAAADSPRAAKKAKRGAKATTAEVAGKVFPVRQLPPLPPELTGELPEGQSFAALAVGSTFRYRIAVERGFNELWEKRDEARYSDPGAPERNWYRAPEGSLVLPA